MPFNGGELIYFNKVWPRPKPFSGILFGVYFIVLGHTSGNAIAFARQVVLTANPPPPLPADGTRPGPPVFDSRIVNLIALSVLGLVCLLHYFTKRLGLFLNRLSALYKVILLFTVASLAIRSRQKHIDFEWQNRSVPEFKAFDSISGFIYIVYSYSGWENSNYVVGELKTKPKHFRLGAFLALALVTTGYILVTLGYYLACSTLNIENGQDLGMAMVLAPTFGYKGAQKGLQVCIAISAFGNLIADVYTSCRVKQAIALHNFLPFSKFFAADSKPFGTPGGALLLHWICSAIVIVSIPSTGDGYSFVIGLFTYGQLAVGVVMGVFYCALDKQLDYPKPEVWNPIFRSFWPTFVAGYLLASTNLMLLFASAWPTGAGLIPRYDWPITLAVVVILSLLYCLLIRKMHGRLGKGVGCVTRVEDIPNTDDFQMLQQAHRRDGAQWKIEWIPEDQRHHRFIRILNTIGKFLTWVAAHM